MANRRRQHPAEFKARVALDAVKGLRTLSQLSQEHGVHPNLILKWRDQLLTSAPELFSRAGSSSAQDETEITKLYAEIGRLRMELDWLKKKV
jgi:putative transposase